MTRNPLADSGLLGINAGASFGVALCLAFFSNVTFGLTIFVSFLGAAVSVYSGVRSAITEASKTGCNPPRSAPVLR